MKFCCTLWWLPHPRQNSLVFHANSFSSHYACLKFMFRLPPSSAMQARVTFNLFSWLVNCSESQLLRLSPLPRSFSVTVHSSCDRLRFKCINGQLMMLWENAEEFNWMWNTDENLHEHLRPEIHCSMSSSRVKSTENDSWTKVKISRKRSNVTCKWVIGWIANWIWNEWAAEYTYDVCERRRASRVHDFQLVEICCFQRWVRKGTE